MTQPGYPQSQSGQTLVQATGSPGVALPPQMSSQAHPQQGYPQQGYPQQAYPQQGPPAQGYPQQAVQQPQPVQQAQAAPQGGGAKTVYEFRGEHSEEARAGGRHKTFFADETDFAAVAAHTKPEQQSNLRSGGKAIWITAGLGVLVSVGLVAFFMMGGDSKPAASKSEGEGEAAAPAAAPAAVPEAPADAPVDPAAAPPVDPAAAPPAEGGAPAPTDAAPAPTPEAAPTPAPEPAPAPAPAEEKKPASKPKPKPKPKPEPEPKKPTISPSKPPRNELPAPD